MESNKLKNIVPLNIEIVAIDPDHFYSSENEDSDYSDCSDSEAETRNYATERNISKNPEAQPTSEPQSSESQTATDSPQPMSYMSRSNERNENDTTPITDLPTSDVLTPDVLLSDDPARSDTLTPDEPDEPVELIDGLFNFVTFNIDEDVVLKDVEEDGKHFSLEAYITDQSESPTSSSQENAKSSISSSPGSSAPPISSSQEKPLNNSKGETTVSSTGFGIGQGKNFAALMKCYNKDKPVFHQSKGDTENKLKALAKSVKDNRAPKERDVKMTKDKDLKQIREKHLKPVKREDVRTVKVKQAKLVKEKDVKPIKIENVKPAKEKLVKEKDVKPIKIKNVKPAKEKLVKENDLKPTNGQGVMKLLKEEKVKSGGENKLKPSKGEVKTCDENKEQIGQKIYKKMENHSSARNTHIATQNSPNCAEEVNNNLDDFTKAILASMAVAQRKPNLEKRRNSKTRKRIFHVQEHSLKFQQFLNDKREKPKMNVLEPSMTQKCSNRIPTLPNGKIPNTTNANNEHLKMPPQLQQNIRNANSVALKTHPQQQRQNIDIENLPPAENSNTVEVKTSPQQQLQNIKTENCAPTDHKEAPAGTRKISIHEYLNRKRSHQSSNNGSGVDIDSNIPTKKRISINEYMKRKVQHEGSHQYTPSNIAPVTMCLTNLLPYYTKNVEVKVDLRKLKIR